MAAYEMRRRANIGTSTLIVIFIVLCLVTFSVLSLGNAKSDAALSERNADAVTEYYRADALGKTFLKQVDQILLESAAQGGTTLQQKEHAIESLSDYYDEEQDLLLIDIPMHFDQALRVELSPDWDTMTLRIHTWAVYNTVDYDIDQSIRVWDGLSDL